MDELILSFISDISLVIMTPVIYLILNAKYLWGEEFNFFIISLILFHPVFKLMFLSMFSWTDFMSKLSTKSFFYTKFGFRFKTVERITDFGAYAIAVVISVLTVLTAFPYLIPSIILLS